MAKNAVDRRVPRTRETLHQALMSLIRKKGYDKITVNDICSAANVGRSTFYAHYRSKDDLKRSGIDSIREALIDQRRAAPASSAQERTFGFSLGILEHARDHLDHYRALAGTRGGALALGKVRQIVSERVRDEFATADHEDFADATSREVAVQYVVGGFMTILTWWLDGGAKLPPERIDAMFRRLAVTGILASAETCE